MILYFRHLIELFLSHKVQVLFYNQLNQIHQYEILLEGFYILILLFPVFVYLLHFVAVFLFFVLFLFFPFFLFFLFYYFFSLLFYLLSYILLILFFIEIIKNVFKSSKIIVLIIYFLSQFFLYFLP